MRDMAREMLQPSLMSASPTLSHDIPVPQPSDHLFWPEQPSPRLHSVGRHLPKISRRNIRVERHLIDDLLDVTRISKGKLVLNLTSVNAHGQIRNVVETCRSEWAGKKIRMQLDLTARDSSVLADEARFQQIVWNLVQNAIKFSRDEGEIRISTANESPGELTI